MDLKERNQSMRDFFNRKSDGYDDVHSQFMATKNGLIDSININATKILDLGAGTGRTYSYFSKKGYNYIGLDFSPKMRDEAFKIHGEFPYILDDMVNVKSHFKSNSVDAVFAVYSLFHLSSSKV